MTIQPFDHSPHADFTYQTYLLRYWRLQGTAEGAEWRFMLIHPYTDARRTFATPAALSQFLEEQIAQAEQPARMDTGPQQDEPGGSNQIDGKSSNELR